MKKAIGFLALGLAIGVPVGIPIGANAFCSLMGYGFDKFLTKEEKAQLLFLIERVKNNVKEKKDARRAVS